MAALAATGEVLPVIEIIDGLVIVKNAGPTLPEFEQVCSCPGCSYERSGE